MQKKYGKKKYKKVEIFRKRSDIIQQKVILKH